MRDAASTALKTSHRRALRIAVHRNFFARFFRRRGGKHIPAEIASQLLQLIHRRGDSRLPFDPHQNARVVLRIYLAALTIVTQEPA
jgi:hypothetical protein